jgi:hypothetical protein
LRQRIVYAAQTRNDARKKWEDDHVITLESSDFAALFRTRKTNGNEAVLWKNGSQHGITSNTEKAGHGGTIDLGFIDEAFAQVDNRLEQAYKPAMITRPQPQLWVVSTAGTPDSVYLREKVDTGRARLLAGEPSKVAYFEWSAPEDADPADRAVWRACMPALGYTITRGRDRRGLPDDEPAGVPAGVPEPVVRPERARAGRRPAGVGGPPRRRVDCVGPGVLRLGRDAGPVVGVDHDVGSPDGRPLARRD